MSRTLSLARSAVAALLLAPLALAQVTLTAKVESELKVSSAGHTDTLAAGTDLVGDTYLSAGTSTGCQNNASMSVRVSGTTFFCDTLISAAGGCQVTGSASGSIRITFKADPPTSGYLRIQPYPSTRGSMSVTLPDAGSLPSLDTTQETVIPVSFGPSGMELTYTTSISANPYAIPSLPEGNQVRITYTTYQNISNNPLPLVGTGCGPDLRMVYRMDQGHIVLTGAKATGATMAAFAFGFSDPAITLPSGTCTLHTDLLSFAYVTIDANGEGVSELPIPPYINGFDIYTQFGALIPNAVNGPPIQLSHGQHFVIPAR